MNERTQPLRTALDRLVDTIEKSFAYAHDVDELELAHTVRLSDELGDATSTVRQRLAGVRERLVDVHAAATADSACIGRFHGECYAEVLIAIAAELQLELKTGLRAAATAATSGASRACLTEFVQARIAACEPQRGYNFEKIRAKIRNELRSARMIPRRTADTQPIEVNRTESTIKVGGTVYPVGEAGALLVQILIANDGDWVGAQKRGDLILRPDRVRQSLPARIRTLIEAKPGAGMRISRETLAELRQNMSVAPPSRHD